MSGFNPFRPRNPKGDAASRISTTRNPSNATDVGPSLSAQPTSSRTPNGIPRNSSFSLEPRVDDDSTSSDEQLAADPFHSNSSQSDDDADGDDDEGRRNAAPLEGDRPRESLGSAPPQAPSADGSSATPFTTTAVEISATDRDSPHTRATATHSKKRISSEDHADRTLPASRGRIKENKPPPPPRSHHGKRISQRDSPASPSSQATASRSTNRTSLHSSPESLTPSRTPGSTYPNSSSHLPASEYFSALSGSQDATESADSLRRSQSQNKRPPTPPLSRRHSQMRRSKSTQSKSSTSRLTISSGDSDSDSSLPPSPGPPRRSFTSSSLPQDRKRISMPPPASSSSDLAAVAPSMRAFPSSPANPRPKPLQTGRRASSHGSFLADSSSIGAPPPPPPRRANTRSSDGGSKPQPAAEEPLPQPSNAQDILANLSQLQKEVDDLRGHYESRKDGS